MCQPPPAVDPLDVRTTAATVRGVVHEDGGVAWKGIRFAAPPVGDLRFAPAADPPCEDRTVVDASADPPQCPQFGPDFDVVIGDEDCLFLNVFRPERRDGDPAQLPVLFFVHGGGPMMGSGHQPAGLGNLYDGGKLAREARAVVVTINYPLGALGFLAHPALRDRRGVTGNQAHTDVLAALRWTRDNIAGFGGDLGAVTVFGESAGAHNTCVLLASPQAAGLFHGAILQSGGCDVAPRVRREAEALDVAAAVGCPGTDEGAASCLRTVSPEAFFRVLPPIPPLMNVWSLPFGSTIDGDVLTAPPLEVIARGEHSRVPVIVGSNADETNLFLAADRPLTCLDLRWQLAAQLDSSFGDDDARDAAIDEILCAYDCSGSLDVRAVLVQASTDLEFTCRARRLARALSENQEQPVWRYHFVDRANVGALSLLGAFHAWDLFYVFDAFDLALYVPSDGERELARLVQRMWGRMSRAGTPNAGPGEVDDDVFWPRTVSGEDRVLTLDERDVVGVFGGERTIDVSPDPAPQCDVWDRFRE